MKKKIHQILTVSNRKGNLSWFFDIFIITLIFLNIVAIVLQNYSSAQKGKKVNGTEKSDNQILVKSD